MEDSLGLYVVKRNGTKERVSFDKVLDRIGNLCTSQNIKCAYSLVAKKTIDGLYPGIHTHELDILAAEHAAYMCMNSSEYDRLASALIVSDLHKETGTFSDTMKLLSQEGVLKEYVSSYFFKHEQELEAMIDYNKDYNYDYSGIKTISKILLCRHKGAVVERPQSLFMRQAVAFYAGQPNDIEQIKDCYLMLSNKKAIHGTPTGMHAGLTNNFTSCFLQYLDGTKSGKKNIENLYNAVKDTAAISYNAGGQSIAISSVPCSTSTDCGGVIDFLKVIDSTSKHVKKLENRRNSGISVYCEQWHGDILSFVDLKLPSKQAEFTCKELFVALWTSDLFMKRVKSKSMWSLFNPATAPGLDNCWGEVFENLYHKYEREGRAVGTISAVELWYRIVDNLIESGVPYILFKDPCNRLSNQQHRGCLKSSNLCTEIMQYSSDEETAVCNIASVSLPAFLVNGEFDHNELFKAVCRLVRNLDRIIELSEYSNDKAILSNKLNRAIGVGESGFADLCQMKLISHTSPEARKLNLEITETIYYGFLRASCDLAKETGLTYPTYEGSLVHKGILNFDLYNHTPTSRWPFEELRKDIKTHGIRHSLGVCGMPTSTGSIVLGNNESREPYINNLFVRGVLSGSYMVVNRHLEKTLKDLDLYTPEIKEKMLNAEGSVQGIEEIPAHIREVFRTIWEVKCADLIDMCADTMIFTDQSRSMSLFFDGVTRQKLSSALFYAWEKGLKTGIYYLRTKAPLKAPPMALQCLMCAT
jgi:ribonucleoside-diphosphate reductase alpha chain